MVLDKRTQTGSYGATQRLDTFRCNTGGERAEDEDDAVRRQRVVAAAEVSPVHLTQREGARAGSMR